MANPNRPFADIAERIQWHRALEGVNQDVYAGRAGLGRTQLKNWESGAYRLSIDGALALRRTYGLSLDFMYEGIDDALPMTLRMAWRERPRVKTSK
jgi:transcriptional regulator with XRE-family HTH domain